MPDLFLVDASGYLYRSYFAIQPMTNSRGESTHALFGFVRSLLKLCRDFSPQHLVAVFDGPDNARSRKEIFPEYKAHRKEMPLDLREQIAQAKIWCRCMGIPQIAMEGVEADDVMGSIAVQMQASHQASVYLCTSDKDMGQVVGPKVFLLNTFKENQLLDERGVEAQFGVSPRQIVDFLTLTGDASDNVPGVSGFGPKTAADYLQKFGSLEAILALPESVLGRKKWEALHQAQNAMEVSRQLLALSTDLAVPKRLEEMALQPPDVAALTDFYRQHGFHSLLGREPEKKATESWVYCLVDDEASFQELLLRCQKEQEICIDTETTSLIPLLARLVGVGLGFPSSPDQAWYLPMGGNLGKEKVLSRLKTILEDPSKSFVGHHLKYDRHVLQNEGISLGRIGFDTLLASYLLHSHSRQHGLDFLAQEHLGVKKTPIEDLIGKGKQQISMAEVPFAKIADYCGEDVVATMHLQSHFAPQLEARGLGGLFREMELPLLPVLGDMERKGIFLDIPCLASLTEEVGREIARLQQNLYGLAGRELNLNSPKQLAKLLFEDLGLPPPKKTATGYSTDAETLEGLQGAHPLIPLLLEYRTLEKLRSTYLEALPLEVSPVTGRIHCTFNQSGTATGRLSCQDPNLQNIPVRTPLGRRIREAFRPEREGWCFLSADYSQIELRLLAHFSQDPMLIQAFQRKEDVHRLTASLIFAAPLREVSDEQRQQAKAVNFGVIYGQQAFGLAKELGIEQKKAAAFIEAYFARYPKVRDYLELSKERARETGKATTLFGREREIPEIRSKNPSLRQAAERLAVNTPLQGTQADLIKKAMLEVDHCLKKRGMHSFLILQIHDELLFEVPEEEAAEMTHLVQECMEKTVQLLVPLQVDVHLGKNWKEC